MIIPDIEGKYGQAWKFNIAEIAKRRGLTEHGQLDGWWIKAPWANMMWHSYGLFLIHLRPVPSNPEPIIHLPGATHEIMLYALNPEEPMNLNEPAPLLLPANFAAQFICEYDELANARIAEAVIDIVQRATLSPDTDYRPQWVARFGDNMIKEKYRGDTTASRIVLQGGGHTDQIRIGHETGRPIDMLCKCGQPRCSGSAFGGLCNDCYKALSHDEQNRIAGEWMKKTLGHRMK